MPLLMCPNDNVSMQTMNRGGVEFDMCPTCRGVWLDRGELEKLMAAGRDASAMPGQPAPPPPQAPYPPQQPGYAQPHYPQPSHHYGERGEWGERGEHGYYKKKHSIFDIFD